jgi:hypothetical protein
MPRKTGRTPEVREWVTAMCDLCQITRRVFVVNGRRSTTYQHLCPDCEQAVEMEREIGTRDPTIDY